MLKVSYQLAPGRNGLADEEELAGLTDVDFRFRFALGDLILESGPVDLSARWGWVPLIDFVIGARGIVGLLEQHQIHAEFEFTESEATLSFTRQGVDLFLRASYAEGEIKCSLPAFAEQLQAFEHGLRHDLVERQPGLAHHAVFNQLWQASG
ncbi:MAG TPA: hypothetical protein VGD78_02855 [Chthoniobacterales bacterium]